MTDANEIARRLTKAQRAALWEAQDMLSNHGGYPFFTVQVTRDPWPEGVAQFLTLRRDRLTMLGLAVKRALEQGEVACMSCM